MPLPVPATISDFSRTKQVDSYNNLKKNGKYGRGKYSLFIEIVRTLWSLYIRNFLKPFLF